MQSHIFRRRVKAREFRQFVKMSIMHGADDVIGQQFQFMKVHYDANWIESGGANRYRDLPVMPVQGLKRPIVEYELMGGGKETRSGDLEGHKGKE